MLCRSKQAQYGHNEKARAIYAWCTNCTSSHSNPEMAPRKLLIVANSCEIIVALTFGLYQNSILFHELLGVWFLGLSLQDVVYGSHTLPLTCNQVEPGWGRCIKCWSCLLWRQSARLNVLFVARTLSLSSSLSNWHALTGTRALHMCLFLYMMLNLENDST